MTIISARQLSAHELAQLGHNTAVAVRRDRNASRSAPIRRDVQHRDVMPDEHVQAALRSERIAS